MILRFPIPTTVYTALFSAAVLADLQILQISLCRAQIRLVWMLFSGPRIRVQPRNCIQASALDLHANFFAILGPICFHFEA